MTKATAETLKLIIIIALSLILFLSFVPLVTTELKIACKRSQIDDLARVLRELENFKRMNNVQPLSYNVVQGFIVKTDCTKEIVFQKVVENNVEKKIVKLVWEDGLEEKIPTEADWQMEGTNGLVDMSLTEGTWDIKVFSNSVIAIKSTTKL